MASTPDLPARGARRPGPNVSTCDDDLVHQVRREVVWVRDAEGRKYLDRYNNVPRVGHCLPLLVEAICRQAAMLNTHTRLHEPGATARCTRFVAVAEAHALTCFDHTKGIAR